MKSNFFNMEHVTYAYMPETDTIIEYDECCDLKDKDKWHEEICSRRRFVGVGYVVGTVYDESYCWSFDYPHLIYVNK